MSVSGDTQGGVAAPVVFVSYARADQARARQLVDALEQAGLNVWWDTLIEGGAAFAKSIETALERCDAVVVLWSATANTSDWVLDEAAKGRELHKLVPVSLDGTLPPLGFRQYHAIPLSGWSGEVAAAPINAIVRGVAAATQGKSAPTPAPVESSRRVTRRTVLLAGTGLAASGVAGILAWQRGMFAGPAAASGNSVAVLPFKNLSGDPGQEYFSDGLSEELRATLARNLRLLVMAQASSAKFRERQDDAVTIAAKLGVAYLLDGAVRRAGETVRITADLIDGKTGFSRWSRTFDRSLQDIFAVQSEIAGTVAAALAAQVAQSAPASAAPAGSAGALAAAGGTESAAAYDAYLRGRALYDLSADEASERAALAQFDLAIEADPDFAPAHAARARSLTAIANEYGQVGQQDQMYADAVVAARRAIDIAPGLADAYSTLGFTLFQGRLDARAAAPPFERSRELGAGEATVLARYSQYCARTGRDAQAIEAMQRALLLDKLNPLIHRAAGAIEYAARRYAESIPPARKALAMNPRMTRTHSAIGEALLALGRVSEARAEFMAEPNSDFRLCGLAIAEHRLRNAGAARAAMDKLVGQGDRVLYQQAQVLAQWDRHDAAIARLQAALRVGDSGLIYTRNDPLLDPLRGDPRFAQLLLSIGFA